jgi:hypothetical protein
MAIAVQQLQLTLDEINVPENCEVCRIGRRLPRRVAPQYITCAVSGRFSSSANPKHNRGEAGQLVDISVTDANVTDSATKLSSNHVSRYAGQGVMDNLL